MVSSNFSKILYQQGLRRELIQTVETDGQELTFTTVDNVALSKAFGAVNKLSLTLAFKSDVRGSLMILDKTASDYLESDIIVDQQSNDSTFFMNINLEKLCLNQIQIKFVADDTEATPVISAMMRMLVRY